MADCRAIEEFKVENKSLREELEKMKMENDHFRAKSQNLTEALRVVSDERDRYKGLVRKLDEDVKELEEALNRPLSVHDLLKVLSDGGAGSVLIALR